MAMSRSFPQKDAMYMLMTQESLTRAQELERVITDRQQRHATSQV